MSQGQHVAYAHGPLQKCCDTCRRLRDLPGRGDNFVLMALTMTHLLLMAKLCGRGAGLHQQLYTEFVSKWCFASFP